MSALDDAIELTKEWPEEQKLKLLPVLQQERWYRSARQQQLPPSEWTPERRVWLCMGGRGAGKTRTGAETLAQLEARYGPGEFAIVAPTAPDARTTCIESKESGILGVLGQRVDHMNINESRIFLKSGSVIYWDGADDGALRMQGKNLKAVWCDEAALWVKWEQAWHHSLAFAIRQEPGLIIVTATPKMGHGLMRELMEDPKTIVTRMKTMDNIQNLDPASVEELHRRYSGTRIGKQELEGEWLAALEGDLLKRSWWRYYEPKKKLETMPAFVKRMPKFQMVVVSIDTPLKDKESSDYVAIQVWGADKANRYLLDARTEKMGYDQAKRAIIEMSQWARKNWRCQHRVLIENAGYGVELLVDLKRELGLVQKVQPNVDGNKGMRAMSASGDLESGNVYLPGRMKDDLTGPDERACPALTLSLVEEAAMFQMDGSHGSHDDQVDAWSQAMNWLRNRKAAPARVTWIR